jgi:proteasome lid subunit RPN8/RPN11
MDLDMDKDHKFKTAKAALRKIREIAHKSPRTEVCGFLGFDEDEEFFVVREQYNSSPSPAQFFLIDPINYLLFKDEYHLVGLFHSHIMGDEKPSEFDIKMAQNCCLPFLIYSLNTKKIHIYEPQNMECNVNIVRRMKALV